MPHDVMAAMRKEEERIVHGVTGADPREAFKETLTAARGRIPWATVTIVGGLGCAIVGGFFQLCGTRTRAAHATRVSHANVRTAEALSRIH